MSECTHHWTVTSPCPLCQQAEIADLRSELERWLGVWDALNENGAKPGDLNKPLAVAASWTLQQREIERLRAEIETLQRQLITSGNMELTQAHEIKVLRAERDALREDAGRRDDADKS
jgi:hypothetical protein